MCRQSRFYERECIGHSDPLEAELKLSTNRTLTATSHNGNLVLFMAPKGIAVVTGGSKGIGRAIASRLAWLGYSIRILSRDQAAAQDAIARFEGAYNHKAMECDVAKRETIQAAFRTIATEGTLTTVINAAGINTDGLVPRLSPSALDSMLTVNLAGAIAVTSEATRLMLRQRQRGSIINISSATAHVANPGQSIYSATKAGLEGFTRTAARELAPKQIRLNCIAPGYVGEARMAGAPFYSFDIQTPI
eukprot:TRINITY_DN12438_c1_g1_i3.p2 TRINITY_DN12438_c1_g1~~TRINITY_DN12438_c1_g1_i3.p2  ORF type:complete len:248 (+),score=2.34 TRINITY_DN12438_c1_g1_i3:1210-1953(+)